MVPVKFKQGWRVYNGGDVATFLPDIAKDLVDGGVAVYVTPVKAGETPPPADNSAADKYADKPTFSKFNRMVAEELLALAAKYDIDLAGETQKQHTKPIIQAVLYPETVKDDAQE